MGKIKVRSDRMAARGSKSGKVTFFVNAAGGPDERRPFKACVGVGSYQRGDWRCAYGKNPRVAIAAAMNSFAKHLRKRKGAFKGLGRKARR